MTRSSTTDLAHRLRRRGWPSWLVVFVVLALLAFQYLGSRQELGYHTHEPSTADEQPADLPAEPRRAIVRRVVDGDTLLLESGERVRLIGVDTPETVRENFPVEPLGPEASLFTTRRAEGRTVELRFDKERRDRHGRTLAYVSIDGVLLNEELIREGFSRAQLQYPYSNAMKRRFRDAETEARDARRGLWSRGDR